jgi:hypothetical protein
MLVESKLELVATVCIHDENLIVAISIRDKEDVTATRRPGWGMITVALKRDLNRVAAVVIGQIKLLSSIRRDQRKDHFCALWRQHWGLVRNQILRVRVTKAFKI